MRRVSFVHFVVTTVHGDRFDPKMDLLFKYGFWFRFGSVQFSSVQFPHHNVHILQFIWSEATIWVFTGPKTAKNGNFGRFGAQIVRARLGPSISCYSVVIV